jgi:hypothetical protein
LKCENTTPVFIFITAEVAFFELASIALVAYVGAPKAKHCVCGKKMRSRRKFVECNFERVPCDRIENRCRTLFFVGKVFGKFGTVHIV